MTDLLIPAVVILILLTVRFSDQSEDGDELLVAVHAGESTRYFSLAKDTVITVNGNLGQMEIRIDSGRTRISESPCPGQDCVRQGWLTSSGEMAVCVPSGVFIIIEGSYSAEDNSHDAVTY